MKTEHYNCDRCGKTLEWLKPSATAYGRTMPGNLSVLVGHEPSGAGDSDDVVEAIDLCGSCAALVLREIVKLPNYSLNTRIVEWAKNNGRIA